MYIAENLKALRKLPHIRVRDNDNLPPGRVRVSYYADLLLDRDFTDPSDAVKEVISTLRKITQK